MARVMIKTQRLDPYKNFKFRVKLGGKTVAGMSKVSGLKRMTKALKRPEPGNPSKSRKLRGPTKYDPITLERGVTQNQQFTDWANKVNSSQRPLKGSRKDIRIEQYNEAGQLAIAYKVFRCWVSEFQALPDLDAGAHAVAIQHIKLENEGWERDNN